MSNDTEFDAMVLRIRDEMPTLFEPQEEEEAAWWNLFARRIREELANGAEPVAWKHDDPSVAEPISDKLKTADPRYEKHYNVPLYTHPNLPPVEPLVLDLKLTCADQEELERLQKEVISSSDWATQAVCWNAQAEELYEQIEQLRAENARLQMENDSMVDAEEVRQLREELSELRAKVVPEGWERDSKRLQFLMDASGQFYERGFPYHMTGRLREYIDLAMIAAAQGEHHDFRDLPTKQDELWKDAVIDELVVCHIYNKEHDGDPRKAIHDAISWNVQVALDPLVSSDAQALIDKGRDLVCPEGSVVVPRKVSGKMQIAGIDAYNDNLGVLDIYKAMIAAAQGEKK